MEHIGQIISDIETLQVKHQRERTTMEWRAFSDRCKEAADFACQICRQRKEGVRLVVHHPFYVSGRRLWEYELHEVQVLCGGEHGCHSRMHERLEQFKRYVFPRLTPDAFAHLNGALSVGLRAYGAERVGYAVAELLSDGRLTARYADAWLSKDNQRKCLINEKESFAGSKACG